MMAKNGKSKIPRTVQESIPYLRVYDNGVIETSPGVFTKAYPIEEINFKLAPDDIQTNIFLDYGKILNSFDPKVSFQVVIYNRSEDVVRTMNEISFDRGLNDGLNNYRLEMNRMLADKLFQGKNNLTQDKYLVVSITEPDTEKAMATLEKMDRTVDKNFRKINMDSEVKPISTVERLRTLWSIYNQDGEGRFENSFDDEKNPVFDMAQLKKLGLTTKDIVGPSSIEIKPGYFMLGGKYGRSLYLESIPSLLSTDFIADLSDIVCNMLISVNYKQLDQSKAMKTVQNMMMSIDGQIAEQQKAAGKQGYTIDLISPRLAQQKEAIRNLMEDMVSRDQKMFYVTLTLTVFGDTKEAVDEFAKTAVEISNNYIAPLRTLFYQQEQGFNSSLPLCLNEINVAKMLTTESASVFIPYTTQELHHKHGVFYGLNAMSNNMIFFDRLTGNNYNALYFGESGNGKSFMAKTEMVSLLLKNKKCAVYVIDPESEYSPIARAMGGEVVDLAPGSRSYVNPLDMDMEYGDNNDPLAAKTDYIISLIEIMMGQGRTIDPEGKSIIKRCVESIYRPYILHIQEQQKKGIMITEDREAVPTLTRLHAELAAQPEMVAKYLANTIEMYAKGDQAFFSHRSNINRDARFIVYDIKNLGTGNKNIGLHVCLNDIWNKVVKNSREGIWTFFYIDEFYLLLQSESASKFLMEIWKRARKWKGAPTGIMQNTEDLFRTADARNIINNTSFIISMSLPKIDRINLKNLLNLSDSQLTYITNKGPGRGIIWTGKTTLPFDYDFPKDTELYKLMRTKDKEYLESGQSVKYLDN